MTWEKGQKLQGGKYVIEQILGKGGFGITYRALQVNLNRPVVIKTPDEYLNHDPEYDKFIERFIAEGQTLARLSQDPHPHIVGVIELFQEGNTHCLVMEFVPGENLFQAVKRRGALPEAEIVTCIRQIGEALMVVHQAGLVHRDAHPGNIMLRSNGKAVLIDFGIAKQIIPATQSSTDKSAHERFAPYEQRYRGSRDPRVDIYCLAASLYYGVTGQNPTNSLARKLDNERLIPPQELISSISKELNQAILNGMALEAKDRPQSMQSWLKILNYKPQVSSSEVEVPIVVTPPQVEEFHRKEVIHGKYRSGIEYTTDKKTKIKIIPWLWLISLLLFHTLMSYILAASHAPFWAVAWAMVWAGVEAMFWLATIDLDSYIFLIVTGTSNLGLGLGWIVYRLFNPS
ncbi:serine/threonine protein kinase [Dolichospermum sp. ST_sed1]|nr:serine/threonine protein kinase [Dolichospermum sp. ST_sed1]MDD1427496.1 serine/threonine protein kinase [Dolichospermum sp. ST_sed9]MDD1434240.1 serine/threonine protein kinase [Dolichospermum sp. ST_sed6]MDD1441642.1 serine/threonine protein kinase [Dolichospermum sp. ST_sed3]MDD1448927.1 serine/threonine protein kinase [Dolichospermum sp. ST_sed8]MDD1453788.1 serine/threonine protein kinase [Dolichospermum sp. ST_sed7]MDD1459965.1 serine/threonine protein kinase [Dolichospermum sp. ST_s